MEDFLIKNKNKFDKIISKNDINLEKLFNIIKKDIDYIVDTNFKYIEDSLFEQRSIQIKLILLSNKKLFWKVYNYLEQFNKINTDSDVIEELNHDGLSVLKNYISKKDIIKLKQEMEQEYKNIKKSINKKEFTYKQSLKCFASTIVDGKTFSIGADYWGRTRLAYFKKSFEDAPKHIKKIINNKELLKYINDYYNIKDAEPSRAIYEEITPPIISRKETNWHIDALIDQCKIMIILEDMTVDSGAFNYVPGHHKKFNKNQKDKYYKMYQLAGLRGMYINHFNDKSVRDIENKKEAILKAGDVVIFDPKIQHYGAFAQNCGNRKNIVLYFNGIRNVRNRLLGRIDKYHIL